MSDPDFDVIVIGSGAGGGACFWALTNRGLKVLLLEAGPAYNPTTDYLLDKNIWETQHFPEKIFSHGRHSYAPLQDLSSRWQSLYSWNHITKRSNPTQKRKFWGYHHVVGLGGSTLHYTGEAHRLNPKSMQMQTRYSAAHDWPVTYKELDSYYQKVEQFIGVAGPSPDRFRWRSKPLPQAAHELNYASTKIKQGSHKLGLSWEANTLAILSSPHDDRPGCNYCNNCGRGCPRRDKGSVDVTFFQHAPALLSV